MIQRRMCQKMAHFKKFTERLFCYLLFYAKSKMMLPNEVRVVSGIMNSSLPFAIDLLHFHIFCRKYWMLLLRASFDSWMCFNGECSPVPEELPPLSVTIDVLRTETPNWHQTWDLDSKSVYIELNFAHFTLVKFVRRSCSVRSVLIYFVWKYCSQSGTEGKNGCCKRKSNE